MNQQETNKRNLNTSAVWFFVAAVFVVLAPSMGAGMNISISPVLAWVAGAALTAIGFWVMLRKR